MTAKTDTEQLRAEFEAWWKDRQPAVSIKEDAFAAYQAGRAALQSQDREDAERYRWLLKDCYRWPANGALCNEFDQSEPVALWVKRKVGDDPCAAIDHARRVEGEAK